MAAAADPFLVDAAIYLGAAVVSVPLFKRLGIGSVVGYLVAGAIIGPNALALIEDADQALHFAEFGVVLLLFVIGLELQPSRLWRLRLDIFGLGFLQVLLSGAAIALGLSLFDWLIWTTVLPISLALALSSTALAVQILREKAELNRPHGVRAFSILLFQDLAIVPLLALTALMAPYGAEETGHMGEMIAIAVAALVALVVVGRYLLRPLFHIIAKTKSDEIFTAAALLVVVGAALLMDYVGLSMAMGAFIAGVLLAESEFRHQLEVDIEPFRGLLLGLLFLAVGMSVSVPLIWENLGRVVVGTIGLILVKFVVIVLLSRAFGSPLRDALRIGAVLSQGGEFGFVVFTVSTGSGLLEASNASVLTTIVALTMALTPAVMAAVTRWMPRKTDDLSGIDTVASDAAQGTVIVAGFGRFGQVVARILRLRGYDLVLIDSSPDRIRVAQTFGNKVFFGDLRRPDTMRMVGAETARAVFLCIDEPEIIRVAAQELRRRYPNLLIFARAYDRFAETEMASAGADLSVREMLHSGIEMARRALEKMGDDQALDETVDEFMRRDARLLRLQSEFGAEAGYAKLREEFNLKEF